MSKVGGPWAFIYLAYSRKYEIEKERLLSKDACVRRKAGLAIVAERQFSKCINCQNGDLVRRCVESATETALQ